MSELTREEAHVLAACMEFCLEHNVTCFIELQEFVLHERAHARQDAG